MSLSGKEETSAMIRLVMPVDPASEDALQSLLQEATEANPVLWTDALQDQHALHVYLEPGEVNLDEWNQLWTELVNGVNQAGLPTLTAEVQVEEVRREDWANSWKKHFHPIEISDALLIQPTWIDTPPKPSQAVVKIDPGLSFGTGNHPTTHYCLEKIAELRPLKGESRSMLDVGCGTGILAIAAAKLGYSPVHGFDNDPDAVRVARENAILNKVESSINWKVEDLSAASSSNQYRACSDIVCANVIYDVLLDEALTLTQWLKDDSVLILSGILDSQFAKVAKRFEELGWTNTESRLVGEWRSGCFNKIL